MGNWSEQQKVKEEAKEKDKTRKEILAKYFLNLSQVAFVGLVIGVVIPLYSNVQDAKNWYALTVIFAMIGNKILK